LLNTRNLVDNKYYALKRQWESIRLEDKINFENIPDNLEDTIEEKRKQNVIWE
jgi:hypothetical protein